MLNATGLTVMHAGRRLAKLYMCGCSVYQTGRQLGWEGKAYTCTQRPAASTCSENTQHCGGLDTPSGGRRCSLAAAPPVAACGRS